MATNEAVKSKEEVYISTIKLWYGEAFEVHPYQISEDVINLIDAMRDEMLFCQTQAAPFIALAMTIGTAMEGISYKYPNEVKSLIGELSIKDYLVSTAESAGGNVAGLAARKIAATKFRKLIDASIAGNAFYLAYMFIKYWHQYSTQDKQFKPCVNKVLANYRSELQMTLAGL